MPKPDLSIVIASCVGSPFIDRCLESIQDQLIDRSVECIVVDRVGGALAEHLESAFPWIVLERRSQKESVPDLRRWGIQKARADYVAIIEEHCIAKEDWIETILEEISKPVAVMGGVVDDAGYDRLMDWAVYFTEYNSYMPPAESGNTEDVCAANCVYRRDLLLEHLPPSGSGYWEAGLNHKLLSLGESFTLKPGLVVYHTGPFGFFYYLNQRYLFSRAFAGTRRTQVSAGFRAAYIILSPLLAPLLWFRTAVRVFKKKRRIGKFLLVTPLMIPITATYVFGECVGFLTGRGDSLEKIE